MIKIIQLRLVLVLITTCDLNFLFLTFKNCVWSKKKKKWDPIFKNTLYIRIKVFLFRQMRVITFLQQWHTSNVLSKCTFWFSPGRMNDKRRTRARRAKIPSFIEAEKDIQLHASVRDQVVFFATCRTGNWNFAWEYALLSCLSRNSGWSFKEVFRIHDRLNLQRVGTVYLIMRG